MNIPPMTGTRIREKRVDLGLRQASLAAAVGISPSYLNLIEHNRRRIGGKLLAALARELGMEAATLSDGADSHLIDQLRAAASLIGEKAEITRADDLATRYPGWSALITTQARRIAVLDERLRALSDRMAHDPFLATALHDVISAVTAIRSTAAILVSQEQIDADWQRRFHENIHNDSLRLGKSSEALIAYLEAPDDASQSPETPMGQVDAYLAQNGHHLASLEQPGADVRAMVTASGLKGAAAALLGGIGKQYADDARALPMGPFVQACQELDYDPAKLCARFGVDFATILRRLPCLPPDGGHPLMGLAVCDAAGVLMYLKPVPGFAMQATGGACPLWPLFTALSRPSQPLRAMAVLPGPAAAPLLCYAIALPITQHQFDMPPVLRSYMLVLPGPADSTTPAIPVGVSCRICPRAACASRREPAIVGLSPDATTL
ncbi:MULTISPECIES: short-chain fatty acyl-CoA regulator family protein [unclassified Yoonia]|uniref:short-chain fatty acyl-CoA regulator family protein n=1 Tax=unclassified Yoonia TaxID=2629118 RepID=UPI002AFEEA01|nr:MULTISPECIES: short-chain fatty acyl-CoA regulator family protein [unclassified Yoonia]